jgi:hypothetical protein
MTSTGWFGADKLDVEEAKQLLKEADSIRMYDMQLLAYGTAVRHKLNLLRAEVDLGAEGGRGELARRKPDRELDAMRSDLVAAAKRWRGWPFRGTRPNRPGI